MKRRSIAIVCLTLILLFVVIRWVQAPFSLNLFEGSPDEEAELIRMKFPHALIDPKPEIEHFVHGADTLNDWVMDEITARCYVIGSGLGLVLATVIIFYFNERRKRRANQVQE